MEMGLWTLSEPNRLVWLDERTNHLGKEGT